MTQLKRTLDVGTLRNLCSTASGVSKFFKFLSKFIKFLNFTGKFAQRDNLDQTEVIRDYDTYWKLITNEKIEIRDDFEVAQDVRLVTWCYKDVDDARKGKRNIAIASFVTSYARVELHRLIMKLEQLRPSSVLYFDTDSVIFIQRKGESVVPLGDYLGDLTDELEGKTCTKFVSGGPKNYALEVKDTSDVVSAILKVKGLTQTAKTISILNVKQMIKMAVYYGIGRQLELQVPQFQITCDKKQRVQSRYSDKVYRIVSEKRWIRPKTYRTFPYGYMENEDWRAEKYYN